MATKRQRRKRRRRQRGEDGAPTARPQGAAEPSPVAVDDQRPVAAARRTGAKAPPPPPWGSFPLSEIVIAIAIVMLIGGFIVPAPRGPVMIGTGIALGSLAGLELAIREHFAGYKSHSTLLAGAIGVLVIGALFLLAPGISPVLRVAIGAAIFAVALYLFAAAFRRRSGGALYRFKA